MEALAAKLEQSNHLELLEHYSTVDTDVTLKGTIGTMYRVPGNM